MSAWKVLLIMLLAMITFGLAVSTVVVPLTMPDDNMKWVWLAGLLVGTIIMGTLLAMYLRYLDRTSKF